MIQHQDIIDRKLVALASKHKNATVRLIECGITKEFFEERYQSLIQEISSHYQQYFEVITPSALSESLLDKGFSLDTATAIGAVLQDINDDPELEKSSMSELDFFIDRIKKRYTLRECERAAKDFANDIRAGKIDKAKSLLANTITTIDRVRQGNAVREGTLETFYQKRIDLYNDRKNNPEAYRGVQSGFPALDAATDGYQKGDLILYVGESGGGKSVNLLHTAFQAWKERYPGAGRGANVVLFSLEMDWHQYLRRFDAMHAGLDSYKIKSASLDEEEHGRWIQCLTRQKEKDNIFYLVDMPSGCTPLFIRNKLEEIRMKFPDNPIDLVVVDYLGIMNPTQQVDGPDWQKQGVISQELKEVARSEKVPILSAVQETRESIKDGGKVKSKNISIIGRSHMIVTNADIILYLRPHQMEENEEDYEVFNKYNNDPNVIHYQVLKGRDTKKVTFRCGVDFSRMYVQPLDLKDDDIELAVANNKTPPQQLANKEDEAAFSGYYETVNRNAISPAHAH